MTGGATVFYAMSTLTLSFSMIDIFSVWRKDECLLDSFDNARAYYVNCKTRSNWLYWTDLSLLIKGDLDLIGGGLSF